MIFRFLAKIIYSVVIIIEVILGLRFIFSLIGITAKDVDKSNAFVYYIFNWSDTILRPIARWNLPQILIDNRYVLDLTALVGILIFIIIAYGLIEIIKAFE